MRGGLSPGVTFGQQPMMGDAEQVERQVSAAVLIVIGGKRKLHTKGYRQIKSASGH